MDHLTESQLQQYTEEQLTESEQSMVESHFVECDTCFETYIHLAERDSSTLSDDFTEQTIGYIVAQHPTFQQNKPSNTFVHYVIAAGFTLLLMMTGIFNYMTDSVDPNALEKQPSFSAQMMEKTGEWLDEITNR